MHSDPPMTAAQWDARYRAEPDLWTKEPNAPLAQFAGELEPGRALDVGAGDGRNAIWLATRGWDVSAIDLSTVALERAAQRAAACGTQLDCVVADWREHDFGEAAYELVVVSFMHPQPDERQALFERVARALVPGGHVFTVGVILADHGRRGPPDPERLYTLERVRHALRGLELLRCAEHTYEQEHSSGRREVTDVVAIGRRP
jgi:SAM-dependent methyltransferase